MASNENTDNRRHRERERNPITGDGMRDGDSHTNLPHLRPQPSPMRYGSEEELIDTTVLEEEGGTAAEGSEGDGGEAGLVNVMTLQDVNSVPAALERQRPEASASLPARIPRQRQRERNPITGDGMTDRDYRSTVPSFKTHGPQRTEVSPLSVETHAHSDVREAGVSPPPMGEKPQSRRGRDRNPITGYGMEERDFRVQIPTFKIHGPQRQGGDPLTGAGYAKDDRDYQRRVKDASDSPLSAPPSPGN